MDQQPFLLNLLNIVIGLQNNLFCSHTNWYGQTDINHNARADTI